MSAAVQQFEYRTPMGTPRIVFGLIVSVATMVVFAVVSGNMNAEIQAHASAHPPPQSLVTILRAMAAFSGLTSLGYALLTVERLRGPHYITLTETSVIRPRAAWSRKEVEVTFDEIDELIDRTTRRSQVLVMVTRRGRFMIFARKLPAPGAFDTIFEHLVEGVATARAKRAAAGAPDRAPGVG